jgi:hypothetical protein
VFDSLLFWLSFDSLLFLGIRLVAFFGFLSILFLLAFFRLVAFSAFCSLLFLAFDVALSAAFFRLVALLAFFDSLLFWLSTDAL